MRQQNVGLLVDPPGSLTKKMQFQHKDSSHNITGYLPARLAEGDRWYVVLYALDPETNTLKRKRYSVPAVGRKADRRAYAQEMIETLNERLKKGWNPFFRLADPKEYTALDDVMVTYFKYLHKMTQDDIRRVNTYNDYTSRLGIFMKWNKQQPKPVYFVYQLKAAVIDSFLDWLWVEQGLKPRTRDNYLGAITTFCEWMKSKGYISDLPTSGIQKLQGKRKVEKNRTVIPREVMVRIRDWFAEHDRHFLLACYLEYYCFIRPRELSYVRIDDVNVKKGTIAVPAAEAKNRKDAVVTLPDEVLKLMIELKVLERPGDWYLFSWNFMPGKEHRLSKYFADGWNRMRKALKLPDKYKFYSLKDTGITDLIKEGTDLIAVRDQARHQSLQMTDLYTPLSSRDGNESLRHHKGYF